MIRFVLFCLSCLLTTVISAAEQPPNRAGEFSQEKYFAGFTKPFISSGVFLLDAEQLKWQVTKPVTNTLLIKNGQVYLENAQGEVVLQPGAAPFVSLLQAIISHDLDALKPQFTFSADTQEGCSLLLPKDQLLSQLFVSFQLCVVSGNVQQVRLNEHNANYTIIRFNYSAPVKPTTAEASDIN
ncbi:outer membrane lipoprotein carrier protein LolA [Pseudoalteromonas haloplanktis]|uniref:Outer membrane lipoprotein carrier protein LolA n=1 Tax=Pseudoalteromonas haloplanktis TaxID=228 RepID=A0ABU1BBM7_PSEHA|nr:outer membrane lipoprotein carrier protein LolA [Pseudoalteromonas haloplanktis]MDQ9091766.1 outer membrane lipoprotein carrier protein LolA [Pseudoalteromonas haloplanktis]